MEIIEMKQGLVYYLSYGGTLIVGRYINSDACNYYFNSYLHNWSGYETFHGSACNYCVKSGLQEVRRATHPEIQSLIRKEIEHNTI